jgi:anti-sigma regulatory factor (Ser/Thr protein kinase)
MLAIEDRSQVGHARRAAADLATRLQFDETLTGKVGLTVTELATNIVKHAGSGRMLLSALTRDGGAGVEVLALDKGPGIADVSTSLRDGHSTSGTMGSGLGAIARQSTDFEVYSQSGRGTALRTVVWGRMPRKQLASIEYGGVCVPKSGEAVAGDDWSIATDRGFLSVLLADGLGHGLHAREAARAAVETLAAHPQAEPEALIQACHAALARTRGAALAVARLAANAERGAYAGVGNIVARVEGSTAKRHLASYNGTVGHNLYRVKEFAFPWPTGALLVMHSDGLGSHWDLAAYPGLIARHPALIAGVLYRDYDRGRDDVSVVVLRNRGSDGSS